MRDFKPVYKEAERPLIGFEAKSSFNSEIKIQINAKHLIIILADIVALDKKDAQSFIDNLQKVVNNIED